MKNNEKTIEVLNDLIKINNDRIAGYEKAAQTESVTDADLKTLFFRMAEESRDYVNELGTQVTELGGQPASDSTTSGKIYRAWMDVKTTFSGNDNLALLSACEFGEDAAQRAYAEALDDSNELDPAVLGLIARQRALLKGSHDLVRNYRDQYEEAVHAKH